MFINLIVLCLVNKLFTLSNGIRLDGQVTTIDPTITENTWAINFTSESSNSVQAVRNTCLLDEQDISDLQNKSVSGTDLWCHSCSETYKTSFDPTDSPCFLNATTVAITRCGPLDKYCKVEKFRLVHMSVPITIDRGCARTCPHGCRYNGFGQTYERCFDCCDTYGCNISSGGSHSRIQTYARSFVLIFLFQKSQGRLC